MRWPEEIDEAIEAIEEADYLTAGPKRDILYNNAADGACANAAERLSAFCER